MNVYEDIVDIIIAILIIFLFPLLYFGQKQDALSQTLVSVETKEFVDEIKGNGYLTKDDYHKYLEELSLTGMLYDVTIEHRQLIHEPEYRFRTPEEVIEEQNSDYSGSNKYTYHPVTTEVPIVNDPVSGNLNTESNESVLASAVDTPASPSHVHTDECYDGIKHIHSGNATSGGGCYGEKNTTTTEEYCGIYQGVEEINFYGHWICNTCGRTTSSYWLVSPPTDYECYAVIDGSICGGNMGVTSKGVSHIFYGCSGCTGMSEIEGRTHYKQTTKTTYSVNCCKTEGAYYKGDTQVSPICNQIVSYITPTHPVQTVAVGDPLITTVTANYLDGSTKVVLAATTFSTTNIVHNKIITLTYSYLISGIPYSKTCTIDVTVIPRNKICVHGHTYNLNEDGSDPGCPYCKAWLYRLEVVVPSTGSLTIYKGTTLSDNGVTLLATYLDGRKETISTGYVDNLDTQYVGSQNVTISYKGKYVYLTVITKRNLILCPICGRYYELYPDGSDPGCPYCTSLTPIFTGNVMEYYDKRYTDEILEELYEGSGTYYFTNRDYLLITVHNRNKSRGGRIPFYIHKNLGENNIHAIYGGYIREDGSLK